MIYFKTLINDTLADDKLKLLGLEGLGARFLLMCYIAKSPVINYLYREEDDPYKDEDIARLLSIELQKWLQIKPLLIKYGGIDVDALGSVGIPKWAEHQSDYYRQLPYRKGYRKGYKKVTPRIQKLEVINHNIEEHIQEILSYFNAVCNKNLKPTTERKSIVKTCMGDGRTPDDIKKAILNFSKDTWEDRGKYCDLIYAIGKQRGKPDNFDKWFNATQKEEKKIDIDKAKKDLDNRAGETQ